MFERYGRVFGAENKAALLGSSLPVAGRMFERLLDQPGRATELAAELLALVAEVIGRGADPMPGAMDLVASLKGRIPLGVASNSPRSLVEVALDVSGMAGSFDAVVCGDEVDAFKPAPHIYLRAAELLGVPPGSLVALEDSPPGVASARAAGAFVVGIPSVPGVVLQADLVAASLDAPEVLNLLG